MLIKEKKQFIYLLLCAMAKEGYKVMTIDLKSEILLRSSDRKYEEIFYFFQNLNSLEFESILNSLYQKGLIRLEIKDKLITIGLKNEFLYPIAHTMTKVFDQNILDMMCTFINEVELSNELTSSIGIKANCTYNLTNPNRVYKVDENTRIITDGISIKLNDRTYLVEDASFTILETIIEKQITSFKVHYQFADISYIKNIIKNIIKFENMKKDSIKSECKEYFEPMNNGNNNHYKR